MIDNRIEYEKMACVESNHWWYRNLHALVTDVLKTSALKRDVRIVDAGCGTGGLLGWLQKSGYSNVEGFDVSDFAIEFCEKNRLVVKKGDILDLGTLYERTSIDVLVSNDTLYYFSKREQMEIIAQAGYALRSNGILILNVPAQRAFSGIHDLSVGILSRFTPADIRAMFDGQPFNQITIQYWPCIVSSLIYCTRLYQRMQLRCNRHVKITSDTWLPLPPINLLLWGIVRLENRFFRTKPFGSSLLITARKK